ncbi:putative heme d1 biosynthesis radical SAM protein NirJ2 [Marinicrinis sediminis]|uniref:Heme d1 biosynthesis radical SAM protein NirJ2 n=1 Tax=Marinicrinis sediminis TaxID=1652465 RepID=A0ABW5REY9_9BACL
MIVSWNTTNQCNMFCDHCYREAGVRQDEELDTQEAKKLLDEIASAGFKIMIFSGGEPLMRPDIVELVAYASEAGLRPVFGTNGTLLTESLARELKEAGAMAMGISLDSLDPVKHNRFRRYHHAYEEAVAGMEACRAANLPFQIHTTVMDWNQHEVTGLSDLAVEYGARGHHIFFLVPTGRAVHLEEESLRAHAYEQLLHDIMDKQLELDIELKPTCAPQFMRVARQKGIRVRYTKGCLAGTSYCIISPTGNVQACAYLNVSAGNVRHEPFDQIWKESELFHKLRTMEYGGGCGRCEYQKICGGCRARAHYYHDGDFMAEEPWCVYHGRDGGYDAK